MGDNFIIAMILSLTMLLVSTGDCVSSVGAGVLGEVVRSGVGWGEARGAPVGKEDLVGSDDGSTVFSVVGGAVGSGPGSVGAAVAKGVEEGFAVEGADVTETGE
jgi:hypothetical protein